MVIRVPAVTGPSVAPSALQAAPQRSAASPELLGGPARQLQQLGDAMATAGGAIEQQQRREAAEIAEARAKDADVQFTQALSDLQFNPKTGYMARQGRAAADTYEDTIKQVQSLQRQVLGTINDRAAREMAGRAFDQRMQVATQAIARHAIGETQKWKAETANARAETSLLTAANDPANAELFHGSLIAAHAEAETQGQIHGWDEERTNALKRRYTDFAYERRYTSWAARDPVAALTHFATSGGASMTPLEREQMRNKLFHAAAPVLADQLNATGGAGVMPDAPPAADGTASAPAPRGIRNNNPGNIMRTDRPWQGEVLGNDPRYASFETPEAGIRAMARTLTSYGEKYGLNTVQGIIARWAPSSENDTGAYIRAVAKRLNTDPQQPLNLKDPATMGNLVRAIIQHENGAQPYSDEQIARGIAAAGNAEGQPAALPAPAALRDPNSPTGHALIDALPPAQRLQVMQMARAKGAQAMADAREQLKGRVQDAQAEYLATGSASNPPPEAEFLRAFGQVEGPKRYREFQQVATLGRHVQQVRNLPAAHIEQLLEQAKPVPGEGFAVQQHNYEILTRAAQQVTDQRKKDPVAYAAQSGLYNIKPLASVDPQALAAELPRRAAAAERIAQDYGTPVALLTGPEASALSARLKAVPVEAQKQLLGSMAAAVGNLDLYKRTMQSIAPDSPVVAVAGIYQARGLRTTAGRDVADLLLRGQAILTPFTKKEDGSGHEGGRSLIKMPEERLMLSEFNATTGDAFKGKEQAMDLFYQATKAVYAARSAEEGDYSGTLDAKRWQAAVQLATGGVQPHNGARIVMPYGMAYDVFQNTLKSRVDDLVRTDPPLAATADDLRRLPLENFGDGKYLFRRGAGYVVNKQGRPLVVDLNPAASGVRP